MKIIKSYVGTLVPYLIVILLISCEQSSGPSNGASAIITSYPPGIGEGAAGIINGSGFGESKPDNKVIIGDTSATIESWEETKIVFIMPAGFGNSQVKLEIIVNNKKINVGNFWSLDSGFLQLTFGAPGVTIGEPTWSPTGDYIYYTSRKPSGFSNLYRVLSSGGEPKQITNTQYNENWPDIDFSSGYIAYGSDTKDYSNSQGDYEILVQSSSLGPLATNVATDDRHDSNPAWPRTPANGITMAFSSENAQGVPVIKLHSSLKVITELVVGFSPRFNPSDNKWLVYAEYDHRTKFTTIFKIDASSGTNAVGIPLESSEQITTVTDWGVNNKILYTHSGGSSDIWIMDSDGKNQKKLIGTNDQEYSARWSPDGKKVVFASHRSGRSNIYIFNYSK